MIRFAERGLRVWNSAFRRCLRGNAAEERQHLPPSRLDRLEVQSLPKGRRTMPPPQRRELFCALRAVDGSRLACLAEVLGRRRSRGDHARRGGWCFQGAGRSARRESKQNVLMNHVRFLFGAALAVILGWSALAAERTLYTCGMHPQVIRNAPGDCPICGMALTPVHGGAAAAGALQITIDPVTIQRMNLKTALVTTGPVRREVRAVGAVDFDESTRRDITTKYEGWLEKLAVNTTWTRVNAGDPLFEIYSPDLYNAQVNFLVARRSEGDASGLLTRAARDRMKLFDLSDAFIDELAQRGEAQRTITFRAPSAGIVIEKMAVQGQMMRPGEVIFRLADLSTVWVLAQIYESDLPLARAGQSAEVRVTFGPEHVFVGEVSLVTPQVAAATRTAVARMVVPNPDGFLRPGMFVDVRLSAHVADAAVLVPDTAVLRTGERNTVFLALDGGRFEPREVTLGARTPDDHYEVRAGLAAGERVVVSGQFMLDSESRHREGIQKMLRAEAGGAESAAAPTPAAESSGAETSVTLPAGVTVYTCPMEEHAHVVSDQPGKCHLCNMDLVPASTVDHRKKSEATWLREHGGHAH
jgi:membrane fusion protein, copper/silver efflux system